MDWIKSLPIILVLGTATAVQLDMTPFEEETFGYIGERLAFFCNSEDSNLNITWLLNNMSYHEYTNFSDISITNSPYTSTIVLENMEVELDQVVIQCSAKFNQEILYSNNSTILLRGTLQKVGNVTTTITDTTILISWKAPFSFNSLIYYNLRIRSSLFGIKYDRVIETNYEVNCSKYDTNSVACSDWTITITPSYEEGPEGKAETITLFNEDYDLQVWNYSLIKTNWNDYHLILNVTKPLCKIKDLLIVNENIESKNIYEPSFHMFHLQKESIKSGYYVYQLEVDFENRFNYNITMTLESSNNSLKWTTKNSTHDICNVIVTEDSNSFLNMRLERNPHSDENTGAFVSLLYCKDSDCDDIDYGYSVYASLYSTEPVAVPFSKIGPHFMYIFDTDSNGSLLPSIGNKCYSKPGQMVNLDMSTQDQKSRNSKYQCSLIYNNDTVGSSCKSDKSNQNTKKQLIIQPLSRLGAQMVTISNVTNRTDRGCEQYSGESYGIVVGVDKTSILPIGRDYIKFTEKSKKYSPEQVCSESESSIWKWLGPVICIIIIALIIFIIVLLVRICKKRKGHFNLNIGHFEGEHKKDN